MPIYEYQCTVCGHKLDSLQKVNEAPLTDCPECGKPGLQKLISASSFQLKGTGWYATDFKTKPEAKRETTHSSKPVSVAETPAPAPTSTTSTTETKKT
ncbi:MAG: zinc ribbon domain-containing protein [Gammaproteobacteria bacterium]|nr:zinc ribbon domain-containing protein [Gammaproteobacteria bacterium]